MSETKTRASRPSTPGSASTIPAPIAEARLSCTATTRRSTRSTSPTPTGTKSLFTSISAVGSANTDEVQRQARLPSLPRRQARDEAGVSDHRPDVRLQFVLPDLLQLGAAA